MQHAPMLPVRPRMRTRKQQQGTADAAAAAEPPASLALTALQGGVPEAVWRLVWGQLGSSDMAALKLSCKAASALCDKMIEAITIQGGQRGPVRDYLARPFLERLTGLRTITLVSWTHDPLPRWLLRELLARCGTRLRDLRLHEDGRAGAGVSPPWSGEGGDEALARLLSSLPQLRRLELHLMGLPPGSLGATLAAACPSLEDLAIHLDYDLYAVKRERDAEDGDDDDDSSSDDDEEEAESGGNATDSDGYNEVGVDDEADDDIECAEDVAGIVFHPDPESDDNECADPWPYLGLPALRGLPKLASLELRLVDRHLPPAPGYSPPFTVLPELGQMCTAHLSRLQRLVWGGADMHQKWSWGDAAEVVAALPALTSLELLDPVQGPAWPVNTTIALGAVTSLPWRSAMDGDDEGDDGSKQTCDSAALRFSQAAAGLRELHLPQVRLDRALWEGVLAALPQLRAALFKGCTLRGRLPTALQRLQRLVLHDAVCCSGPDDRQNETAGVRLAVAAAPFLESLTCRVYARLQGTPPLSAHPVWRELQALEEALAQAPALTDPRVTLLLSVEEGFLRQLGGTNSGCRSMDAALPMGAPFRCIGRQSADLSSTVDSCFGVGRQGRKAFGSGSGNGGLFDPLLPYFKVTEQLTVRGPDDCTVGALGSLELLCPPARQRITLRQAGEKHLSIADVHTMAVRLARAGRSGVVLDVRLRSEWEAAAASGVLACLGAYAPHPGVLIQYR